VVQLDDVSGNGVVGGTVTFLRPANSARSTGFRCNRLQGRAQTFYTAERRAGAISSRASGTLHQGMSETVQPGPAIGLTGRSGNSRRPPLDNLVASLCQGLGLIRNGTLASRLHTRTEASVVLCDSPVTTDSLGKHRAYTLPPTAKSCTSRLPHRSRFASTSPKPLSNWQLY